MVEVDGVEVPKGWEVKPLPEIIDFLEGPGIRNWQYTDEEDGIKFINIRCIQNGDLTLTTANKIKKLLENINTSSLKKTILLFQHLEH